MLARKHSSAVDVISSIGITSHPSQSMRVPSSPSGVVPRAVSSAELPPVLVTSLPPNKSHSRKEKEKKESFASSYEESVSSESSSSRRILNTPAFETMCYDLENDAIGTQLCLSGIDMVHSTKRFFASLAKNRTLIELDLRDTGLNDRGIRALAHFLMSSPDSRIERIYLDRTNLRPKGADLLVSAMRQNFQVRQLVFSVEDSASKIGTAARQCYKNLLVFETLTDQVEDVSPQIKLIKRLCEKNVLYWKCVAGEEHMLRANNRILGTVPSTILSLTHLRRVDLSNSRVNTLPSAIGGMLSLKVLLLAYNTLESLPESIGFLTQLRILDLSHNRLTSVPSTIALCKRLTELCLCDNELTSIPSLFGSLPRLKTFSVEKNPFLDRSHKASSTCGIPREVLKGGSSAVLAYYRNMVFNGQTKCHRMRLVFVGNGNVGKTSLVCCLKKKFLLSSAARPNRSGRFPLETMKRTGSLDGLKKRLSHHQSSSRKTSAVEKPSFRRLDEKSVSRDKRRTPTASSSVASSPATSLATDGIDICTLSVPNASLHFSVWDFAGQDVYYATHQFFLSPRAIYVLVFNLMADEQSNRLEYWLQNILVRAGQASVIIVGTHLDDPNCTTDHVAAMLSAVSLLEQRYAEMIRGAVAVSTTNGDGVAHFEKLLVRVAKAQPFYGEQIPAAYDVVCETMNCRKALCESPILSLAEFSAVAMDCKVAQESDVLHVANFLHELGEITYFPKGTLRDIVVLDPQWLTKLFSTVITMKANYVRDGLLKHAFLEQLWREPLYPRAVHQDLLSLFQSYELIYQLRPGLLEGESLIPSLLPDEPPSASRLRAAWPSLPPNEVPHGRVYRFAFFPDAFFSRLMVRVLNSKDWRLLLHWKYGIIISREITLQERVKEGVEVLAKAKETRLEATVEGIQLDLSSRRQWSLSMPKRAVKLFLKFDPKSYLLTLQLRGTESGSELRLLVETMETLINDWVHVPVDVMVPCIHCLQAGHRHPHLFAVMECEAAILQGSRFVTCQRDEPIQVRVDQLAPDLVITNTTLETVDSKEIRVGPRLGEGSFSTVRLAIWRGERVALKILKHGATATRESTALSEFRREVWMTGGLSHPNIVALRGVCNRPLALVLEFMNAGTLHGLYSSVQLGWHTKIQLLLDVAQGMAYLHSLNPPTIHRDLKCLNVLVHADEDGQLTGKVADFGVSRVLAFSAQLATKVIDNPLWLAPEILQGDSYDTAADVYSFGIMMWEVAFSCFPWPSGCLHKEIEEKVCRGDRPSPLPSFEEHGCPKKFTSMMEHCWHENPAHRPLFSEVSRRLATLLKNVPKGENDTFALEDVVSNAAFSRGDSLWNKFKRRSVLVGSRATSRHSSTSSGGLSQSRSSSILEWIGSKEWPEGTEMGWSTTSNSSFLDNNQAGSLDNIPSSNWFASSTGSSNGSLTARSSLGVAQCGSMPVLHGPSVDSLSAGGSSSVEASSSSLSVSSKEQRRKQKKKKSRSKRVFGLL